jgi:serpin B
MSSNNPQNYQAIGLASNQFGMDYVNEAKEGNYFISPLSISTAMAMTYAGAKGRTAEDFEKVMHFDNSKGNFHELNGMYQQKLNENLDEVQWNLANRLWGFGPSPFEQEFLEINSKFYNAPIEFGATEGSINSWVEKQTQGKIKDLLPPGVITVDTRLILTNAVYFKGDWKYEFKKKDTKKKEFFAKEKPVKVEMMFQKGGFGYSETMDYQAVRLPYKSGKQSMVVILPKQELKTVEKNLTNNEIRSILRRSKANVNLHLPKFKLEYMEVLNPYLIKKGMSNSFGGGANFTGIMTAEPIWIDMVIHKSFVEVSEEGTEAAAATAVVMTTESLAPSKPRVIEFNANKPFLFFIMDDVSESILFMGKLENPENVD